MNELLTVCARRVGHWIEDCSSREGINESQFWLLWKCRHAPRGGFSQNELACSLQMSPAHVSALVEQLRCRGLLSGRKAATDRRRRVWRLTEAGNEALERLSRRLAPVEERLSTAFGSQSSTALSSLLGLVTQVMLELHREVSPEGCVDTPGSSAPIRCKTVAGLSSAQFAIEGGSIEEADV